MKSFSFQRDMRAKHLLKGGTYSKNGFNVFYANGFCVSTFCGGTHKFSTLGEVKDYIKNYKE